MATSTSTWRTCAGYTLHAAALQLCLLGPVAAEAAFTATATADLTLLSVVSTGSLVGVDMQMSTTALERTSLSGFATLDADNDSTDFDDPLGLGFGFDLSIATYTNGRAGNDALNLGGRAEAELDNFALITVRNDSNAAVDITFDLAYFVDAGVDASGVLLDDDAYALADFELLIDGVATITAGAFADLLAGPVDDTTAAFAPISISLAPGQFTEIELSTAALGEAAASPVPVPPALPLFAAAVASLRVWRCRLR